ncbi:MAG: excinuclease ABC subunit UvrB [Candidatus Omnitrophica bacterium]|nr:excinuclease ABC subunit UvrB [Candidatus Omnitrophota bacterium]
MASFTLVSHFKPQGDQPQAIEHLVRNFNKNVPEQILLGVTGSGKTFTMANVIEQLGRPTIVISHNKTLAAQLYSELKNFFPRNAVEYFVSYYDYYQPEAYIPHTNTYIEKDASINENLDKLRIKATGSLLSRDDVIVVASVSAIYGLGAPEEWAGMFIAMTQGEQCERDELLRHLVSIQYERSEQALTRGTFRVRGDTIELFPSYTDDPIRLEFFENTLEHIFMLDHTSFECSQELKKTIIYPAKHFVVGEERIGHAIETIKAELVEQLAYLRKIGKDIEAERLESRTNYDLEMLQEVGYCSGIENYSRHLAGRAPGSRPYTLIDYFPDDFLLLIDESHVTLPQIRGMYNGDRARKEMLVEHGFRLPSALDNRPLRFDEFETLMKKVLYVSATPGPYERKKTKYIVEQLIRPTGLLDPEIEIRPAHSQIDDLIGEIRNVVTRHERVLVTTLTKRMAEDLAQYLSGLGIRIKYLHSDLDAIERVEILKSLRLREFDCLVGINLLREGLDLPEVSLVAILEADKEGFLRSEVSLIQTAGRAARNVNGRVILYADTVTESIAKTMAETKRRRAIQEKFNKENGIVPRSIQKAIFEGIEQVKAAKELTAKLMSESEDEEEVRSYVAFLEKRMLQAASVLDFEKAAQLRDDVHAIKAKYSHFFKES